MCPTPTHPPTPGPSSTSLCFTDQASILTDCRWPPKNKRGLSFCSCFDKPDFQMKLEIATVNGEAASPATNRDAKNKPMMLDECVWCFKQEDQLAQRGERPYYM